MNGEGNEKLIESILRQLDREVLNQSHEIDALLGCLLECVREISKRRKQEARVARRANAQVAMSCAESRARQAIAPHLKGVTEAERENFRSGKLDPMDVWLGVSCGHFIGQEHE